MRATLPIGRGRRPPPCHPVTAPAFSPSLRSRQPVAVCLKGWLAARSARPSRLSGEGNLRPRDFFSSLTAGVITPREIPRRPSSRDTSDVNSVVLLLSTGRSASVSQYSQRNPLPHLRNQLGGIDSSAPEAVSQNLDQGGAGLLDDHAVSYCAPEDAMEEGGVLVDVV